MKFSETLNGSRKGLRSEKIGLFTTSSIVNALTKIFRQTVSVGTDKYCQFLGFEFKVFAKIFK